MPSCTFAEILAQAADAHGASMGQLANRLRRLGVVVHRGTLTRWRNGESCPSFEKLEVLQHLPEAIGLSPDEAAEFHRAVSKAVGFPVGGPKPHVVHTAVLPQRLHFGADDLPPFAGRAAELAELRRLVLNRQPVIITGLGGVGKTRLAQELLRSCVGHFAHGCDYLAVVPGQESTQLIRNVAHLLGVELRANELGPDNRRLTLGRLREQLQGVNLLFLVDNVENAGQVHDLVWGLPAITWVFTARRVSLKRIGVHPVHLQLPGPDEAVGIFQAHLRAALVADRANSPRVGAVVERLGRLPFAIRLAAGLLANGVVATVAELDEWLTRGGLQPGGALPGKLRRLFDGMLASVPTPARRTLELCGVFASPTIRLIALQAVGAAAGIRPAPGDWEALADYSLVELPDEECVVLHALLHEHVRRRLRTGPDFPTVWTGFKGYYLELARAAGRVPDAKRDYQSLVTEEPNLLSAADAFYDAGDWAGLKGMWPALSGYLWTVGDYAGYEALDHRCLEAARATADDTWAAVILSELGFVEMDRGAWAAAEALFRESQAIHDAAPEQVIEQARLRRYRAMLALEQGRSDDALRLLAECERRLAGAADALDAQLTTARLLLHSMRMSVHHQRDELAEAEAAGRLAEALYERLDAKSGDNRLDQYKVELGDVLFNRGQEEAAEALWRQLAPDRTAADYMPHLPEHAEAQLRLAWLAARAAQPETAAELTRAAGQIFLRHGQGERVTRADALAQAIESGTPLPDFAFFLPS